MNEWAGIGNFNEFTFRGYDSRVGRFISVDPLSLSYPYYTPYQFAGNTPVQAIDIEGGEPQSVVQKFVSESIMTIYPEKDDPNQDIERLKVQNVTFKFTSAAVHLLSLVSGISPQEIAKVQINNAVTNLLPAYDPEKGGGAMTLPTGNSERYDINLTTNFFTPGPGGKGWGRTDYSNDAMAWLDLNSHEVGHIKDIHEIGNNKTKYMATFIAGYAKNKSHDGYRRENRADKGRNEFRNFNNFINSYYGKGKLKTLFENNNNSPNDIIERIDQWWGKYQETKNSNNESKPKSNSTAGPSGQGVYGR